MTVLPTIHRIADTRQFGSSRYSATLCSEYREHVQTSAEAMWAEVKRVERMLATEGNGAGLAQVNRMALDGPVTIDYELVAVLEDCQRWLRRTGGFFSVAAGYAVPESTDLDIGSGAAGLPYTIDRRHRTVRFVDPSFQLNLHGYRQAYALDSAAHVLLQYAIFSGLLEVGPVTLAIGKQPNGEPWIVPIIDRSSGQLSGQASEVGLVECALATVPAAARPGPECAGGGACTVIAPSALEAQVLGTALANMGQRSAGEYARALFGPRDGISVGWSAAAASDGDELGVEWLLEARCAQAGFPVKSAPAGVR